MNREEFERTGHEEHALDTWMREARELAEDMQTLKQDIDAARKRQDDFYKDLDSLPF